MLISNLHLLISSNAPRTYFTSTTSTPLDEPCFSANGTPPLNKNKPQSPLYRRLRRKDQTRDVLTLYCKSYRPALSRRCAPASLAMHLPHLNGVLNRNIGIRESIVSYQRYPLSCHVRNHRCQLRVDQRRKGRTDATIV